ncbi:MAG: hypothetical protein HY796_00720 [Elusimicrobia bacterium]|nr:hypothetical protein [Elusimicrobiota bacterium]
MTIKKKRCRFCRNWFPHDPRTERQICCEKPECRKQRKITANRRWRLNNPDYDKSRAGKKRIWARGRGYWRYYRQTHPAYVAADNKRRRKAYKNHKFSANQDAIAKIALEKLASIRDIIPNPSANQDMIARRGDVIVDYLFLKESSANRNATDLSLPSGP